MQDSKFWQLSYWSSAWQEMGKDNRRKVRLLLLVHFILSLLFVITQGILFDEPDYFSYAVNWAKGHPERAFPIMDSKTPMMAVSLVPVALKPFLPASLFLKNPFIYLQAGRPFMYVYQLLGVFTVCCWLYRKMGNKHWFIPLLFFCFDPLIFSYGMFIGSDLASASLLVTAIYAAWRFTETKHNRYWLVLAVTTALAVVTKASMLFMYPLLAVLLLASYKRLKTFSARDIIFGAAAFIIIQLMVINLAYYATGTFTAFGEYHFTSEKFSRLQANMHWMRNFKMPVPAPFIQGIDMLQQHAETGGCLDESTYRGIWLFDKVSCKDPVWYYYLVVAFYKFPLFIWLLIIIAFGLAARNRFKNTWQQNELFAWVPLVYFLLILSFANNFQIGIRHAIILLPFLYIAIAPAINMFYERRKKLFVAFVVLHIASLGRYLPNLLSYTNELVWNKTMAFHIFRDSSLDYGQSVPWVKEFIKEHPGYKQPSNVPDTGYFIITVGHLYSEQEGEAKNIAWLRNNFHPVGNYRFNILLFSVTENDLKKRGLFNRKRQD